MLVGLASAWHFWNPCHSEPVARNMKKWIIGSAVVVLLALLAAPMIFRPSDDVLIKEALDESVKASREGRPGGVMDYLSSSLKFNDDDSASRGEIAQYIKRAKPDIVIANPAATINGETASVVSPVTVTFSWGPVSKPIQLDNVEILLAKETGTKFLVVPTVKWRIREIKAPEADVTEFAE